jgi:hypothetical protein
VHAAPYPIGQLNRQANNAADQQNESDYVEGCQVGFRRPRRTGSLIVPSSFLITEFGTTQHLMERTAFCRLFDTAKKAGPITFPYSSLNAAASNAALDISLMRSSEKFARSRP